MIDNKRGSGINNNKFSRGELHSNLSGKDELQGKNNTLIILWLRENFIQSDKLTDQLKETQTNINFIEN